MIPVLAAAVAAAPAPLRPGVWSSVRVSRESGDYDGLELRIPAADARAATLTICEGGCSGPIALSIVRDPAGFGFDIVQPILDEHGRPGTLPVRRCHARYDGDVLLVQWLGENMVDVLRRRRRPLALPHETPTLVK